MQNVLVTSTNVVLPEEICPFPVADRVHITAVKRVSKAKSATLISGSPFKAQLIKKNVGKGGSKRQSKSRDDVKLKRSSDSKLQHKSQKINRKVHRTQKNRKLKMQQLLTTMKTVLRRMMSVEVVVISTGSQMTH